MSAFNESLRNKIRTISRISSLINSSLDIREVLNNALAAVEQFIEVETSSIFELDSARGELFFACARGPGAEKIQGLKLKIGEGIAGYVAQTEKPVIVGDVQHDPRFLELFDHLSGFTTKSMLCVPIMATYRLVGVMELLNKKDGTDFNEEDLDIVTILANQIGVALENARLYQKLQDKLVVAVEELKFTQSRLFQSERLAALGKLAQGVAHEVRNPITIIGGMARLLSKKIPPSDPGQEFLGEITGALSRLEMMVKEVESFARIPESRPLSTDILEVIRATFSTFGPQFSSRGVSLEIMTSPDLPPIPLDAHLISQVFGILIENALEAMPGGGNLSITLALEAQCVKITLQDTGTGIPAEILPLVFDPFFSTKPRGTGMGLTIAHRIISEHKGELCLASTPGVGTTVELRLPRWPSD
jgi:signal transduction histidine kinase